MRQTKETNTTRGPNCTGSQPDIMGVGGFHGSDYQWKENIHVRFTHPFITTFPHLISISFPFRCSTPTPPNDYARTAYMSSRTLHTTTPQKCPSLTLSYPWTNPTEHGTLYTCIADECNSNPSKKCKGKGVHNRPGVAQRVPGGLGSQISWHSAHEGGEVSLTHRPPLPPGNVPGAHFH